MENNNNFIDRYDFTVLKNDFEIYKKENKTSFMNEIKRLDKMIQGGVNNCYKKQFEGVVGINNKLSELTIKTETNKQEVLLKTYEIIKELKKEIELKDQQQLTINIFLLLLIFITGIICL